MSSTLSERAETDKSLFGFWIYILTDCMLFATLFATFIVLRPNINGGPTSAELFSMPYVLTETILLLVSSFTCGLAMLAMQQRQKRQVMVWLGVTALLGAIFLAMELYEFSTLLSEGHSWTKSGSLSGFFTLVATHGAHITVGLIWIASMIYRIYKVGLTSASMRKLTMLSIFWHFLDVVWIFIFSIVYLLGVAP